MKETTKNILLEEMENHAYGCGGEYSIDKLFKIYTTHEIEKYADLFKRHVEFATFVKEHAELLDLSDEELKLGSYKSMIFSPVKAFAVFMTKAFFKSFHEEQVNYKKLMKYLTESKKDARILDVGAGKVPYSSILMARDKMSVSAMDKFALSNEAIKTLGVHPIDAYFKGNTDIKEYDLVAGKRPCGAIESVVENCSARGVPYFLELCDCEAPGGRLEMWYDVLKSHDPDISFDKTGHLAFHLNLSKDKINELVDGGRYNFGRNLNEILPSK